MKLVFLLFLFASIYFVAFAQETVEVGENGQDNKSERIFDKIWQWLKEQFKTGYSNSKEWIIEKFGDKYPEIKDLFASAEGQWNAFLDQIMEKQSYAKEYLEKMEERVKELTEEIKSKAKEMSEQHLEALKSGVQTLKAKVDAIHKQLKKVGVKIWTEVNGYKEDLMQKLADRLEKLIELIDEKLGNYPDVKEAITKTAEKLNAALGKYYEALQEKYGQMEEQWNKFVEKVKVSSKEAVEHLKSMSEKAEATLKEYAAKAKEMSKQQLQALKDNLEVLQEKVMQVLHKYPAVEEKVKNFLQKVADILKNLRDKIEAMINPKLIRSD